MAKDRIPTFNSLGEMLAMPTFHDKVIPVALFATLVANDVGHCNIFC